MLLNLFIDLFCFETRPRVFIQDFNASCTTFVLGEVFSHGRLDLERKFSFYFPVGYILFIFPGFFSFSSLKPLCRMKMNFLTVLTIACFFFFLSNTRLLGEGMKHDAALRALMGESRSQQKQRLQERLEKLRKMRQQGEEVNQEEMAALEQVEAEGVDAVDADVLNHLIEETVTDAEQVTTNTLLNDLTVWFSPLLFLINYPWDSFLPFSFDFLIIVFPCISLLSFCLPLSNSMFYTPPPPLPFS